MIMIFVASGFLYLAVGKNFEPTVAASIGFGIFIVIFH